MCIFNNIQIEIFDKFYCISNDDSEIYLIAVACILLAEKFCDNSKSSNEDRTLHKLLESIIFNFRLCY